MIASQYTTTATMDAFSHPAKPPLIEQFNYIQNQVRLELKACSREEVKIKIKHKRIKTSRSAVHSQVNKTNNTSVLQYYLSVPFERFNTSKLVEKSVRSTSKDS